MLPKSHPTTCNNLTGGVTNLNTELHQKGSTRLAEAVTKDKKNEYSGFKVCEDRNNKYLNRNSLLLTAKTLSLQEINYDIISLFPYPNANK